VKGRANNPAFFIPAAGTLRQREDRIVQLALMKITIALLGLACGVTLAATPDSSPVALRCGHLLDIQSGNLIASAVILTAGGKIQDVGPGLAIPSGMQVIDLPEATCLPGLIDVHVHLTGDPTDSGYQSLGVSVPRSTVTGVKNARLTLLAGFTSVRNVGASGYSDVALRDGIEAGDIDGPRMLVSGPPLGITGGHCDNDLLAPEFHYTGPNVADGPWAARAKVREVVKYGADLIKVCASGGVLSKGDQPGTPQYTLEEMQAIADEAHKLGRKVAAHAHGTQSIKDAIRAGIDSIEHASLIDDEGIALAKQHGTFLVFDIYNDDFILQEGAKYGMLPESLEKERKIGKLQRENFRHALLGGARMAFGTDAGVYPHGNNAKQFAIMTEYGMTPVDAIRSATVNAAELLGRSKQIGVVAKDAFADIIAVQGDPRDGVKVLENVKFVMKGGHVYKNGWAR
jgi:imidazolonepropionase-like amidohydrolase